MTEMLITYPHYVNFLSLMKKVNSLKAADVLVFHKGGKEHINLSVCSSSELYFRKDTSKLRVVVINLSEIPFIQPR